MPPARLRLPVAAWLGLLLVALPRPAAAGKGETVARLFDSATPLRSLGKFLSTYIGECKDPFERVECERHAAEQRQRYAGTLLRVRLPDRHGRLLRVVRDLGGGKVKLALTPFFDASGYGLSRRPPRRFDRQGNPRVPLLPLRVRLPEGVGVRDLALALGSGNARIELVFRPRRRYVVQRPRRAPVQGVAAEFLGIRVTDRRTGRVLFERRL